MIDYIVALAAVASTEAKTCVDVKFQPQWICTTIRFASTFSPAYHGKSATFGIGCASEPARLIISYH